jgi:hypothetical protein
MASGENDQNKDLVRAESNRWQVISVINDTKRSSAASGGSSRSSNYELWVCPFAPYFSRKYILTTSKGETLFL